MNNGIFSIINHYMCDEINDENICKYHLINKINYIKNIGDSLVFSAKYKNHRTFYDMLNKYQNSLALALEEACANNDDEIALELSNLPDDRWNYGMKGAFKSGNINLIELMNTRNDVDPDWDMALDGACEGGNIEMIKLAFEKGAKFVDGGLMNAIKGNKPEVFKLLMSNEEMEKIGINTYYLFKPCNMYYALTEALHHSNTEMIKLVLSYIDFEILKSYNTKQSMNILVEKLKNKFPEQDWSNLNYV